MQMVRLSREEFWNTITHAIGMVLSVVGFSLLLARGISNGDTRQIIALSVFGISMVLLYAASTFYHLAERPDWKFRLQKLDHVAIYILIAGTYTPFALLVFEPATGFRILLTVWSIAVLGLVYKLWFFDRWPKFSLLLYLAMGWLVVFDFTEFLGAFSTEGLVWLLAGGLSYTAGTYFFSRDHKPLHHAIWHVFVLGGTCCHFVAVWGYIQ